MRRVHIDWGEMTREERSEVMLKARWAAREHAPDTEVPATTRVLAIASGKGGVGKSSVTVNLAAAIAATGFTVGVLDADIWGFSVPRMLGVEGRLAGGRRPRTAAADHPQRRRSSAPASLKVVSTGLLVDDEGTALMWRGLMLTKAVEQFLARRRTGATLDYLLIDMPPGTGDVQMGLARLLPRTDLIIVTTPAVSRPEGGDPRRRHGPPQLPAGRRRDREHEHLHVRPRRDVRAVRRRAAARRWPTRSASSCSARCRSSRPSPPAATPAQPVALDGDGPGRRGLPRHRPT